MCLLVSQVFFFKAQLVSGNVTLGSHEISDHAWVCKEEMDQYVIPVYNDRAQRFMMEL